MAGAADSSLAGAMEAQSQALATQARLLQQICDLLDAQDRHWAVLERTVSSNVTSTDPDEVLDNHRVGELIATFASAADAAFSSTAGVECGAIHSYAAANTEIVDNWGSGFDGGEDLFEPNRLRQYALLDAVPADALEGRSSLSDTKTTVGNRGCNFPELVIADLAADHLFTASVKGTPTKCSVKCLNVFSSSNGHHARDDGPVFDALGNDDLDGRHHHLLGRRKQAAVASDVDVRPGPAERAAGVALEPGIDAADAEDVEEPHPNVTALHDVYEDARGVHLVLELCSGGELFDRIKHLASDLPVPSIPPIPAAASSVPEAAELELYGITDDLREFVKGMTISTFCDFPMQDEPEVSDVPTVSNVRQDLNEWQARHGTLVLSAVKEISKFRYELCPRYMKERKFWRVYFLLVNSYIAPFEKKYFEELKVKAEEEKKDFQKEASQASTTAEPKDTKVPRKTSSTNPEHDLDVFLLGDLGSDDEASVGGAGTRLYPLTKKRAKPAMPLDANYRRLDIPVSNCLNSNISKIYVLTQFNSASLNRHLSRVYGSNVGGYKNEGFVEVLAVQQSPDNPNWFQVTTDAVRQCLWLFEEHNVMEFLILAGAHLYRMDYEKFIQAHRETDADISVAALPMDEKRATAFGLMKIDEEGRIIEFAEKPKEEQLKEMMVDTTILGLDDVRAKEMPYIAGMGIYVFSQDVMLKFLADQGAEHFLVMIWDPGGDAHNSLRASCISRRGECQETMEIKRRKTAATTKK